MYINKIITYKNAWQDLNNQYGHELDDITRSISDYTEEYLKRKGESKSSYFNTRELWEDSLSRYGWFVPDNNFRTDGGNRINIRSLGPIKNGISAMTVQLSSLGSSDFLSRWLFQQTTLAIRYRIIQLPILVLPLSDFVKKLDDRRVFMRGFFEFFLNQLEVLSPLSHHYPFVILGYSDQQTELEVTELEADPLVTQVNKIIDRSIEFPPEYHQAGLNILSFFSTFLREQYPEEDAKVKIEQNGLIVRLIVESKDGKSEIIEKALHEYQLIVSGAQPPEAITKNEQLVLEIRNELRIAKFRIESQQDIISLQNTRIDKLLTIVETGLSNKTPIIIDFRPTISSINTITINQNISNALNDISELKSLVPSSSAVFPILKDLEGSMEAVEREHNPEVVKNSPAMSKFKKLIDKVSDDASDLNKVIKAAETGWETFKCLAGNYNKIAQWCGLPQVPTIFTK